MWIIRVFAVLFVFCLLGLLFSCLPMKAALYGMADSRIGQPITIVLLADLHSTGTTSDHKRLVAKVADQKPDIIALVGDMIDDAVNEPEVQSLVDFVAALMKIAPVYYSLGNDELAYITKHGRSVLNALAAAGTTILDETYQDINVNGNRIRIGGLYANAFRQDGKAAEWQKTSQFLGQFESADAFKLLLCHRPDSFALNPVSYDWDVDLVLSGHTHGGLVRAPLLGGLYAAGQGLLPKYDYGQFQLAGMKMVITSGLSGYKGFPRIWNRKEIAVVQLRNG